MKKNLVNEVKGSGGYDFTAKAISKRAYESMTGGYMARTGYSTA
jgi:hypothetical protein